MSPLYGSGGGKELQVYYCDGVSPSTRTSFFFPQTSINNTCKDGRIRGRKSIL